MAEINTMGHSESSQCKQDAEEQSLDLPANVMARLRELDLLPTEIPEHPKAIEIRRQVEHYFSDENLATDEHLRTLMGGTHNLPVSLGQVLGWKRMRQYKPKNEVIQALKNCTSVQIINNRRIQRLVPYIHIEVEDEDTGIATIPRTEPEKVEGEIPIKKGYEIRNGVIARVEPKRSNVTGFEESYTEGPIRPEEHAEEEEMYATCIPVSDRIETGIYRFVSRRKFDKTHRNMFDKFLRFGGIDISPPAYTGKKEDLKDADALYKARVLGQHSPPQDAGDPNKFEVDFLGIAQCFLGSKTVNQLKDFELETLCKVMVNFYNYFLLHNICSEFSDQIRAARELATIAPVHEFPLTKRALDNLPGRFHRASSLLFGGYQSTLSRLQLEKVGDGDQGDEDAYYDSERAKLIVLHAVLALGTDKLVDQIELLGNNPDWSSHVKCLKTITAGLEIMSITSASQRTKELYAATTNPKFKPHPIGTITCQHWTPDLFTYYDLPKGVSPVDADLPPSITFWVEDSVLEDVKVGLKIDAIVRLLDFGGGNCVWVLDRVNDVYCSFYRPTLNELIPDGKVKMVKWKVPVPDYIQAQFSDGQYCPSIQD